MSAPLPVSQPLPRTLPHVRPPPCRPARWQLPGEPTLDWQSFLAKKNAELKRLNGVYLNLLNNSGVDVSAPAVPAVCAAHCVLCLLPAVPAPLVCT